MHELARRIKEQRLIDATQKGLTGLDGKIGTILKGMGEPIIVHEGGRHEELFGNFYKYTYGRPLCFRR